MRTVLWPSIAWLGVLEALPVGGMEMTARVIAIAAGLGTLTMLIYRLGVWRQQMEHTKQEVVLELRQYREESSRAFERIERRLDAIDQVVARFAAV